MSVKKEANGRRSVTVEFEVPGTPEEVWQAIATGPGISSWFVPTEIEEKGGKPVAVKYKFGPGVEPQGVVTIWDPPGSSPNRQTAGSRARRRSRPSGALKRAEEAPASSALSIACSPARTNGTTSWKVPHPDGQVSWKS